MSKLELKKDAKGAIENGFIRDVTFGYVKLQTGSYKYQSKSEREYTVDVIVDKTTAKAFKKAFPKNGYKEVDTSAFKDQYKIDPPFPDEDEQFVIKMKADCQLKYDAPKAGLKAGDPLPYAWSTRPKAFVPTESGKVKDITLEVLISNGSTGDVSFGIMQNEFGIFPQFTGILVKDLIEYKSSGANNTAFGEVEGGFNEDTSNIQQDAEGYERKDLVEDSPTEESPEEDLDPDVPF